MINVRTIECVLYKRHHISLSRGLEGGQKEKRLESAKTLADDIILVKKIIGECSKDTQCQRNLVADMLLSFIYAFSKFDFISV